MNPSLLQFIAADHLALAAGCAAGVGMCFFFCAVQLLAHRQSSGRAPKVAINAAIPGLAAIAGKATGPRTLASPISGKPCYIYRTSIWQLHDSVGKKDWKNVAEETGHVTFLIEDETGELLVEPSGAELDLRQDLSEEYGRPPSPSGQPPNSPQPSNNKEAVPDAVSRFLARNGITLDRPTRVAEYCLQPEARVVVTGTIAENSAVQAATVDSPVRVRTAGDPQPEVIRLASGATPQPTAHMSQQAKIAAALAKAGLAQRDMWAKTEAGAPPIPTGAANGHPKPEQSQPNSTPDATTTPAVARAMTMTMRMTKGPADPTFIISNHQPENLISVGWKFVALVLGGSTVTLGLYALLLAHLR